MLHELNEKKAAAKRKGMHGMLLWAVTRRALYTYIIMINIVIISVAVCVAGCDTVDVRSGVQWISSTDHQWHSPC